MTLPDHLVISDTLYSPCLIKAGHIGQLDRKVLKIAKYRKLDSPIGTKVSLFTRLLPQLRKLVEHLQIDPS